MAADPYRPEATETSLPQLSWRSFLLALAITLAIFFLLNPIWRRPDIGQVDRNIGWSYAPIPLLVLGLLALERKLRWSSWVMETLRLTLVKFAITFLFANTLWAVVGPPAPAAVKSEGGAMGAAPVAAPAPDSASAGSRATPAPTPIDPARTGRIEGVVTDDQGAPQAGVLVAVTGGLEGFVFARRADGVELHHDGESLQPPAVVVQAGEPLVLYGASDALHTAAATDGKGREVLHVPLVPGSRHAVTLERALGPVTLRCKVDGRQEHATALAIVDNPFAAWTGGDGRFSFGGVPAGDLELTVWGPAGRKLQVPVRLQVGGAELLALKVP